MEILTKNLIAFLVDDQQDSQGQYTELISEFVLKNENNEKIQNGLDRIKQGSILYIGLNYNINEIGSLTKELTLYLGTEILFSLIGYNGEIFKQLADDFFNQVRAANSSGQRKIILRYFADVKKEVDEYFFAAQEIVEGRIVLSSSVAQKADWAFSDTKKQYDDGKITKDQLAARIITLRNKPVLPEHLQREDIDDIMDFSPEFLSRFEEQVNSDREAIKEKDRIIESLHAGKNAAIAFQESTLKDKELENSRLQAELDKYHQKDAEEKQRKENRRRIIRFIWGILWKFIIVSIVVTTSVWICNRVNPAYASAIGIAVSVLGLIPTVIIVCKKDFNNCFRNGKT